MGGGVSKFSDQGAPRPLPLSFGDFFSPSLVFGKARVREASSVPVSSVLTRGCPKGVNVCRLRVLMLSGASWGLCERAFNHDRWAAIGQQYFSLQEYLRRI
jgi:hypothetical protein